METDTQLLARAAAELSADRHFSVHTAGAPYRARERSDTSERIVSADFVCALKSSSFLFLFFPDTGVEVIQVVQVSG